MQYPRVAALRTAAKFREHLDQIGAKLAFDDAVASGPDAPLAQPYPLKNFTIGNRFCILPMEGWDGTTTGYPTEFTTRRWQHFGLSGAKLIWGGEAVAVRPDGRANPNQLMLIDTQTQDALVKLRETLESAHREHVGPTADLLIGLQLTHSGRFCRPVDKKMAPQTLYNHPFLNPKFGLQNDVSVMSDADIAHLIDDFIRAAGLAHQAGFAFVDIKHCHGYLGHEFLSAVHRPGRYGGSFENRTRFLREIVAGIRAEVPGLDIGVRLSAFDWIPFKPGPDDRRGVPENVKNGAYEYAFGSDGSGTGLDLTEPHAFLKLLTELEIELVCITAGSPYYTPHIQRPATFPPSDGYQPPEDPLLGVARQINVTAELKRHHPNLAVVGSGYSYLQDWLPNVAQHVIRTGQADFVGLGRMVLSYPELPADTLAGRGLQRKRICRTFSDCTTAPRNGLVSGCYPLDEYYKSRPEAETLAAIKKSLI